MSDEQQTPQMGLVGNEPLQFRRVAILGLGLMGASLGMALRATHCAQVIAGFDAAPGSTLRARERGAIDSACASLAEAVADADLVVLAVPVLAMRDLLTAIAPLLAADAQVTDLGSTKVAVVAWGEEHIKPPACFVGGHPMTGSEQSGVEAARAELYQGCVWCVTPTDTTTTSALDTVRRMVEMLGAQTIILSPAQHDQAVAAVSHLPRLAATALTLTVAHSSVAEQAFRLAASGFRDTTRVASGDPRMARDICLTNTAPLVASLDAYVATLQALREQLVTSDPTIEDVFRAAKETRDQWLGRVMNSRATR